MVSLRQINVSEVRLEARVQPYAKRSIDELLA
jgi:hypothetical protein